MQINLVRFSCNQALRNHNHALAAAGGLAGSDVGPGHGNKRHRVAIELTTG
jgi:hypothetical protein